MSPEDSEAQERQDRNLIFWDVHLANVLFGGSSPTGRKDDVKNYQAPSFRGGTGKTSASVNVGVLLAMADLRS